MKLPERRSGTGGRGREGRPKSAGRLPGTGGHGHEESAEASTRRSGGAASRDRAAPRLTPSQFDRAFTLVKDLVHEGTVPCAILAVADKDMVLRTEAFGSQNGTLLRNDDVSPVFSVTRPVVAAATAQLWERGLLGLHEPVWTYLPRFKENGKDGVLVRHLLTHTSGLSEAGPLEAMRKGGAPGELEKAVLDTPLDAAPGSRQRDSNAAFVALGMIIRAVSGIPHPEYLEQEIFSPLGMKSTGFDPSQLHARRVLSIPNMPDLGMCPRMEQFIPLRLAAAGMWSTAADLLRFGQLFLSRGRSGRRQVLSPATCLAMMSPQTSGIPSFVPGDFDGFSMGLGWYIPVLPNHALIALDGVVHSGAGGCQLFVSERWGLAVAVITARIRLRTENILNAVLGCLGPA